ncbi:flagellar FliJ protein [Thermosipho japonicus]|uniref:Flagellar FliJ protein n=1 Tax=Thermosipho japonicus TaxID=90323 RepID=A0A841GSW1_9BACT|nr:flagellar export protein FliJ [Thermosipho japonicus]MBB6062300.1 flagellar FliJ protein [Thermosipho japonicus]
MKFRLQKLLDFASKQEELIKQELFKVRMEKKKIEEEIQKTVDYLKSLENEIFGKQINGLYLNMLLEIKNSGEKYIESLKDKLYEISLMEEKILKDYLEKRKERKSLEKLKERFKNKEYIELQRKDIKNIDEIAERKHFFGGEK